MRDLIKKYRCFFRIFSILILILLLWMGYINIKLNMQQMVESSLKKYAKLDIKFNKMKIKKNGTIEFNDVLWKNEKNEILLESKKIILYYNIFNKYKIRNIKLKEAKINLEIYNKNKANILLELDKNKDPNKNQEIQIIKKIEIENSILNYIDFSYDKKITKKIKKVNGEIKFNENKSIEMALKGENDKEKYKINLYSKPGIKSKLKIDLKNIEMNSTLLQYGYRKKNLKCNEGKADVNLLIDAKGITGNIQLKNAKIEYEDIIGEIKKVNGKIEFDKSNVKIIASGYLNNKKINFGLNYLEKKINIEVKTSEISYEILKKYKTLANLNIPIKGIFKNILLDYDLNNKELNLKFESDKVYYEKIKLENAKVNLKYKDNKWEIKNLFLENNKINNVSGNLNFKGFIKNNIIRGNYFITEFSQINLTKDYKIKGTANFDIKTMILKLSAETEEGITINLNYNLKKEKLDLDLEVKNKLKIKYGGEKYILSGSLNFNYLLKDKILLNGYSNIKIFDFFNINEIHIETKMNNNKIEIKKVFAKEKYINLDLNGVYNLSTKKYELNIQNLNLDIISLFFEEKTKNEEMKLLINATGRIVGENLKIDSDFKYKLLPGKFFLEYGEIYGETQINYDEKIEMSGNSQINFLKFGDRKFQDLRMQFHYHNDTFFVDWLKNNRINLSGNYKWKDDILGLKFNMKNYILKEIKELKEKNISINIKNIVGEISGKIESPKIKIEEMESEIINDEHEVKVSGKLEYEKGIIRLEKLKLDKNNISGIINVKEKKIQLRINLLEKNYKKFFSNKKLDKVNLRILGEINLWGNIENLSGSGSGTLDNIYIDKKKYPNVFLKFTYGKGNIFDLLNTGVFNFSKLNLEDDTHKKILSNSGIINLENKFLSINTENKEIDLGKLNFTNIKGLTGKIKPEIKISGNIDKLNYLVKIKSEKIGYSNIEVEKFTLNLSGDEKKIELKKIELSYNKNKIYGHGSLNISPFDYELEIKATKMDIKFLELFLKNKVQNLDGKIDINLKLEKEKKMGEIALNNISFDMLEKKIAIKNLNANFKLDKTKIFIKNLQGILNNGKIYGDGVVNFEEFSLEKSRKIKVNVKEKLIYLKGKDITYDLDNYSKIKFNTNLEIKNNNIRGDLIVTDGILNGLDNLIKEEKEKETKKMEKVNLDINVKVKKKFKININKLKLLKDLESNIEGEGTLKLKNNKMNFMGTISLLNGVLTVNKNDFRIESGIIVFDDPYQEVAKTNPAVAITARTEIAGEGINVNVNGYLKDMQILFESESKLSNDEILSLLTFHNKLNETSPQGVVKDILDAQLKSQIFNPISKKIEKILGLSKIELSTKLFTEEESGNLNFTEDIRLGAKMELGKKIYKEILYLNGKIQLSETESGKIDYYDIGMDYKLFQKSNLKIGIRKYRETEDYELDFGIWSEKEFDNLFELFKFK